ncbi:hypothetical protein XJ32_07260 [Helicobacter bilis]|uniref:Restriction endonuclease subunit S n=1 Tax=Helicobacter bilis TaxID=37372 RepID=A0A1Q2LHT8_9HELI|nr:restriction endonuclease subunit S [Helicobacter bilis]AQQ59915.1 hypothetical protein XJ32_07260 [Helicobacter bilis]
MAYVDIPQTISSKELLENDCNFSASSYKFLTIEKTKQLLSKKYENLLQDFYSLDGYAFSSNIFTSSPNYAIPLIQISNVNQSDFALSSQFGRFIPKIHIKERFLLDKPCILLSLTGGENQDNISVFCEGDKKYLLNQRVSAYFHKANESSFLYLFLAFTKHHFFKSQMQGKGGVQKNIISSDKEKLYIPKITDKKTIDFIETLTKSIIKKEALIKTRHKEILNLIESELLNNQLPNTFTYTYPNIKELQIAGRLDTGIYCEEFKKWNFIIKNYKYGSKNLIDRGFTYARGTSLEKNFIGTRVDSDTFKKGYYELLIPTNITEFGTISKTTFIGTKAKLKTIQKGDIIFGGEATFKSCVIIDDTHNIATNYHGIRIINTNNDFIESIFMRCFLEFWRVKKMLKFISVGGQGGHCAPSYFHLIETPLFPQNLQEQIAKLYHNENAKLPDPLSKNFTQDDKEFCQVAGIYELDLSIKQLKTTLNRMIDDIINE